MKYDKIRNKVFIKPYELEDMFKTPERFVKRMKQIHELYGLPYDETESLKKIYEYIENRNAGGV